MRAKYYGKSVQRDEFGQIVHRYSPRVTIFFSEKELALVQGRLEASGYRYDVFMDGIYAQGFADVYISGKEEACEFMETWKKVKRNIKKAP